MFKNTLINDHFKFALVYGFNMLETMMVDISQLQQPKQETAPPPQPQTSGVEALKPSD